MSNTLLKVVSEFRIVEFVDNPHTAPPDRWLSALLLTAPPGVGAILVTRGVLSALIYLALVILCLIITLVLRPVLEATGDGLSRVIRQLFKELDAE